MKIFNLEAIDMGSNQDEIAEFVLELINDKDFKTIAEFTDIEGALIEQACKELQWNTTPQNGGFIINWDSSNGEFN